MSNLHAIESPNYATGAPPGSRITLLPLELIRPGAAQMRRVFDSDALDDLAESIRSSGLIQPIVVRSAGSGYELLAGERRWRAAQRAGMHEIQAIVRDDIDDQEAVVLGLIENLQRESLTPIETAYGLKELSQRLALTHAQAAEKIGKSRVYVTNFLRLLNLCAAVQDDVNGGRLSMGHARALATLPAGEQARLARLAIARQWSVRVLESRLRPRSNEESRPASASEWRRLERRLGDLLGNKVQLRGDQAGKGEMTVRFHSFEELDGLLSRLGYREDDR